MRSLRIISIIPLSMFIYFCLLSAAVKKEPVSLWMIGDSTMSIKPNADHPERGWGMCVQQFFSPELRVRNHAKNGRSTRSFRYEGRWDTVRDSLQKGDFVLIQFGHNDSSEKKHERYATPDEYRYNLEYYVRETRESGANPILCTPIMRRRFDDTGKFYDTHGLYPDIVREVASEMKVPLIDLHRASGELLTETGEEASKELFLHIAPGHNPLLPEGLEDNTHFSEKGALQMASLFIEGVKAQLPELAEYLKK